MSQRVKCLDILRLTAALTVAISHFLIINNEFSFYLGFFAHIAVEIFFVLSGFVLAPQLANFLTNPSYKMFKTFLLRRWIRTIPPYWIALLTISILTGSFYLSDFLKYVFFIQNIFQDTLRNDYFPISWSLSVEEWFYFIFPLFLWSFRNLVTKKRVSEFVLTSVIFLLSLFLIKTTWIYFMDEWNTDEQKLVFFRIDAICYGFLLFFVRDHLLQFSNLFIASMLLLFFSVSAGVNLFYNDPSIRILEPFLSILAAIVSCLFLLLFLKNNILFHYLPTLFCSIGANISYSIYLFHLPLIYAIRLIDSLHYFYILAIYLLSQILFSLLFFALVERPLLRARPNY